MGSFASFISFTLDMLFDACRSWFVQKVEPEAVNALPPWSGRVNCHYLAYMWNSAFREQQLVSSGITVGPAGILRKLDHG